MELYKYCNFDLRAQRVLMDREVWYSTRSDLNDPYDCNPRIDFDLKELDLCTHPKLKSIPRLRDLPWDLVKEKMFELFSENHLDNVGVYCLSRNPISELMWAHYAANHEGILIGWEAEDWAWPNHLGDNTYMTARNVLYTGRGEISFLEVVDCASELENLGVSERINCQASVKLQEIIQDSYLRKNVAWSSENEVRLINISGPGLKPFKARISSITYGARFKKYLRKQVEMAVNSEVEYYEISVDAEALTRKRLGHI